MKVVWSCAVLFLVAIEVLFLQRKSVYWRVAVCLSVMCNVQHLFGSTASRDNDGQTARSQSIAAEVVQDLFVCGCVDC